MALGCRRLGLFSFDLASTSSFGNEMGINQSKSNEVAAVTEEREKQKQTAKKKQKFPKNAGMSECGVFAKRMDS